MVAVRDIIDILEGWAPRTLAEEWDSTGLLVGDPDRKVNAVFVTLDVTHTIVKSATEKNACVISHHPIIFKPLKSLSGTPRSLDVLRNALVNDVPLYAAHTNLDKANPGVSEALAAKLGILATEKLLSRPAGMMKIVVYVPPDYSERVSNAIFDTGAGIVGHYSRCSFTARGTGTYQPDEKAHPFNGSANRLTQVEEDRIECVVSSAFADAVLAVVRARHPYEEPICDVIPLANTDTRFGYGAVGMLESPMPSDKFIEFVGERLGVHPVTGLSASKPLISRVAVMGGTGGGMCASAVLSGADAFVTGEIGYHTRLDYGESIFLVDAGHRATELPVLEKIAEYVRNSTCGGDIDISVVTEDNSPKRDGFAF